jgi:hypothetical protein
MQDETNHSADFCACIEVTPQYNFCRYKNDLFGWSIALRLEVSQGTEFRLLDPSTAQRDLTGLFLV